MATSEIPESRPYVTDAEVYNARPDRSALTRKLAGSLVYMYARDLRCTPSDHVYRVTDSSWSSTPARNWINDGSISVANGAQSRSMCRFLVPDHDAYASFLKVYLYCEIPSATHGFTVYFENARGMQHSQTINNATLGGTSGWVSLNVGARPGDEIEVYIQYATAGGGDPTLPQKLQAICANWEPLDGLRSDITVDTSWVSLSQAFYSNGSADSSHGLRWIQRKTAQLLAHRPKPVVAKWFPDDDQVNAAWKLTNITGTTTRVVGRYKFYVSEHCPTLSFAAQYKVSGTATFALKVYLNGSGVAAATATVGGTSYGWSTPVDIAISSGNRAAVNDIRIDAEITGVVGTVAFYVPGISVWEKEPAASDLGLPGAETIPAAFPFPDPRLMKASQPIYADTDFFGNNVGRAQLIKAVIYLAAKRMRHLVSDCRYADYAFGALSDLSGSDNRVQSSYYLKTGPNTTGVRVFVNHRFFMGRGTSIYGTMTATRVGGGSVSAQAQSALAENRWLEVGILDVVASTEYEFTLWYEDRRVTGRIGGVRIEEVALSEDQF